MSLTLTYYYLCVSTHSRAEAAASYLMGGDDYYHQFQHTAARRRLRQVVRLADFDKLVSTHSRAEAAAFNANRLFF